MSPGLQGGGGRPAFVRPWLGGTTDPASAAKPINRGAGSGAAIRLRQLQAVVVHAGTTTVREPVRGAWLATDKQTNHSPRFHSSVRTRRNPTS